MRLAIIGHLSLDEVLLRGRNLCSLGGPPAYAGLSARRTTNLKVDAFTRFGRDLPRHFLAVLKERGITLNPSRPSEAPTTRFILEARGAKLERKVRLVRRCEILELKEDLLSYQGDAVIVSPIAGELLTLPAGLRKLPLSYLDPQGFMRSFEEGGIARLKPLSMELLTSCNYLKLAGEEARIQLGGGDLGRAVKLVRKGGMKGILLGHETDLLLVKRDGALRLPLPRVRPLDTTGAGDILAGAFLAQLIKGEEEIWALALAIASASLSLTRVGIEKALEQVKAEELAQRIGAKAQWLPLT